MMNTVTRKKTILFLLHDTDPILLRVIKNKFKKEAGWESILSTEYDEAMVSIVEKHPDAVLTEIILEDHQGRTGFDFIEEMKSKLGKRKTTVMIFTDLGQDEDLEKAKKLGVEHYFVKSQITLSELIKRIQQILK